MSVVANSSLVILLVEDNRGDVVLFQETLDAETPSIIHVVGDGKDALRFLRRQAPFADAPRPDVIVMDLDLPRKSGQEVLAELAIDPAVNTIPVAILTTLTSKTCLCDLYPKKRCLYFTKTGNLKAFQGIVRQIVAHGRMA